MSSEETTKETFTYCKPDALKGVIYWLNTPPSPDLFDVTVTYPSNQLPEWFAPLQSIVEDETFTSMDINLGDRVTYHITISEDKVEEALEEK